jgi:hypothetical protein
MCVCVCVCVCVCAEIRMYLCGGLEGLRSVSQSAATHDQAQGMMHASLTSRSCILYIASDNLMRKHEPT